MDPPTILALKQAFLELATRQLAQPMAPSRAWQRKNDARPTTTGAADAGRRIPPKVVDDVLARANQLLLLHARRVHTPAAIRHVAEQLDQLYQKASDELIAAPGQRGNDALDRGTDYSTTPAIFELPAAWDNVQETDALPLESRRYNEQVARLKALAEQRTAIAARVQSLHGMASLLRDVSSARTPAQTNLVTRDGPVEAELERMRLLLARVGDRVSNLPDRAAEPRQPPLADGTARYTDEHGSADTLDVEKVGQQRARALLKLL